jgi:hypothetical protein
MMDKLTPRNLDFVCKSSDKETDKTGQVAESDQTRELEEHSVRYLSMLFSQSQIPAIALDRRAMQW